LQSILREICILAFSKLAVILWTRELQKRLDAEAAPVIVTCVHPGVADTSKNKLPSLIKPLGFLIMKLFFTNPNEGSHTSVIAAASPDVRENADMYKGAYLEPVGKVTHPSKVAQNAELSHELWATAETFLSNIGLN
jgi:NAD(P)-dependent dehydrogenase (short-subunit alcohol dehydrogenase family)